MKKKSSLKLSKPLPKTAGVYYMKNSAGVIIYVGKAVNLQRRVSSYFQKAHDSRIEKMVSEIGSIDFAKTDSALEALILEANEIKRLKPKYNVKERDNKSFIYLAFTLGDFPKPLLIRGQELAQFGTRHFRSIFGPYLSSSSIRAALKILRKIFPYSTDEPNQKRPCFYHHLKLCPGVCVGAINSLEYLKNIHHLEMVFEGKKKFLLKELKKEMRTSAASEKFEKAAGLRNQIFSLEHIRDIAVLTREERQYFGPPKRNESIANIFGRIEGYDISNISGAESVGSMVVFENGEPKKNEYRKFLIKDVKGINDVAMMKEILNRRFSTRHFIPRSNNISSRLDISILRANESESRSDNEKKKWKNPDIILIDGGWGQVNAAKEIIKKYGFKIPIIGIAKGFKRKQDQPIFEKENQELSRIAEQYKYILLRVRDEAHRFAVSYHRKRMRGRI